MSAPSPNRAEARMAALGVEPILVEEAVAAAACGFRLERFRAECPIKAVQEGRKRLLPLDDVKAWGKWWWRQKAGQGIAANDRHEKEAPDWLEDFD